MKVPHRANSNPMQLQMTPMIDVVFQLLIFFVCTSSFQAVEQLFPTLLSTAGGTSAEAAPIDPELAELEDVVVHLARRGTATEWRINERTHNDLDSVRTVLTSLARIQRNLPVILDVAADVPLGDVIDLYDLCRALGFEKVQFAARAGSAAQESP